MRVRYMKTASTPDGAIHAGDVVSVPTARARELVAAGLAIFVDPDEPEAATASTRETATIEAPDEGARPPRRIPRRE
jgi:hypothetical protein